MPRPRPSRVAAANTSDRTNALLVAALIAAAVVFVFVQVRAHQYLNFDDPIYVTDNAHVRAGLTASGIAWAFGSFDVNWHPMTWITHMLDVELFGLDPGAHLLVNMLIHLANALLLFFLLRKLTGFTARSAFVALLFAVHPLHVESVAWISERKDVLSSLFLLLTLWCYADFARDRARRGTYALALLFFVLGLMSKGMLVTLPFVLLLLDYWPLQRFDFKNLRPLGGLVVEKLPFFLLLVPSIFITYTAQRAGGAVATNHPLVNRLGNAVTSYGAYLRKTVWPMDLAIPYPWRESLSPVAIGLSLVVLIGISVAGFVLGRERRYLFTGWFWFVGMLVPVIGIVQIGWQSMADRYTYLPHIGLFTAVVWLVAELVPANARQIAAAIGAVVVLFFAFVAQRQVTVWRDSITLFANALSKTSRNSVAHVNLGSALVEAGDQNRALQQLQAAVRTDPTSTDALVKLARLELQLGRNAEAVAHLEKARTIDPAPETLALLATARGNDNDSMASYAAAIAKDPDNASLRNDYAAALARAGRDQEALAQYREAVRLGPTLYDVRMNLGALLSRLDMNGEARDQFSEASRLRPASPEPHVYLALINANTGRLDLAIMNVQTAMSIDPREANVRFTNAVRMPPKETNLQEYLGFLQQQAQGGGGR